jgi:cholesterol transport system auxiliary component
LSRSTPLSFAALLGGCVVLAGCVTVFPKVPPAQLYDFGVEPTAAAQAPPAGAPFDVVRVPTTFEQAASGDRMLTSNNDQAAYIAQARWVSPAAVLFDEAEVKAFDDAGGPARLIWRGGSAPISLQLDVQTFEADYPGNLNAAPAVVVRVRSRIVRASDRQVIGDRVFESRKPAADNRVSAIVQAFNAATTDALGQIVAWTDGVGPSGAPPAQ